MFRAGCIPRSRRRHSGAALLIEGALAALALSAAPIASAQVNVTTHQNDIARTGQNLNETILNTSNVNSTQFGKLFSQPVNGAISAQPLYLSGITMNGAAHNVLFIATTADLIYAFDANSNQGADASPLWNVSLLDAAHGASAGARIYRILGVSSTPVIDPVTNTLYVASLSFESDVPVYRLHALDVATGAEKFGGPVTIAASVAGAAADGVTGQVKLIPRSHKQDVGLLLLNGIVYIGFASSIEDQEATWHGWILGYDAGSLAQTGAFCISPNGKGGGVWMSGSGLAADQLDPVNYPYGRMFAATGNGDFTAAFPYGNNMDYGDSVVDLDLTNGALTVTDDFTPSTQAMLYAKDRDQGSGGAMVLPTQTAGTHPHLLVQAGKSGTIYLLDRDSLGGYNPTTDQVVQALPLAVGNVGVWSSPAYWNGNVYYWGAHDHLKQFPLVNGLLSNTPATSLEQSVFPGATPSISATGGTQGIVWTIDADALANSPAILEAHDASNVATTLYSSATNAARDSAGSGVRYSVPTIANGMVYVGTSNQLDVYGLFDSSQTSTPAISPGSKTFVGSVRVTITDATPNAAIYYTTDGTAATTSSTRYTGSILVTSSEAINAVASAPGLASSYQAWASLTKAITAPPTFSPAEVAYPGAQSVAIGDSTADAMIYYTTDGTMPTLASPIYSGPITVSASETLEAVALGPGRLLSSVGLATYTIASSPSIVISDSTGFVSAAGLSFRGAATLTNNALQLSLAGSGSSAGATWYTTPVSVQAFTTDFDFKETAAIADGFTFTLQNSAAGLNALGSAGGGLGYQGIGSSVALKFDLFNSAGEGIDSTGFYTNGDAPTMPAVDMMDSGVNLSGSDILHAHITYDGTTLALTLIDTVTGASFATSTAINISAVVGGNTAYVGFTAGTSRAAATQTILDWTYVASPVTTAATPTFGPAPGTYPGPQSVTIDDATAGAAIHYTTDGTTPTIASSVYSGAVTVRANETLKAIAVASGYATSAVASAIYKVAAPTPTFTPAAGTYSGPQSVTIGEAVDGATIYYTTDGTTPTKFSSVYASPINVSTKETVKAIAVASGYVTSAVGKAAYTITP